MRRRASSLAFLSLVAILPLLIGACTTATETPSASASPSPQRTADIRRTKLDITYSALTEGDVHKVSSKKVLEGAIAALVAESKRTGGKGEFPAMEFQDVSEQVLPDFKRFADAAAGFAALNPQLSPDRFADVAIQGMITTSPDCHTYYVTKDQAVIRSRPEPTSGGGPQMPSGGASLGGPDQAGLTGTVLPNGVAYITFREFTVNASYKITDEVKKVMTKALGLGATSWLFDLRGNVGGFDADTLAAFFLPDGAAMLQITSRVGIAGSTHAIGQYRLPDSYQLPVAIILNDRGGSAPEVFAADLKENGRATIVGRQSIGCLGSTSITNMTDGSELAVVSTEFVGAKTGFKYNNVGVPPDVAASDAEAVSKAIEVLTTKRP